MLFFCFIGLSSHAEKKIYTQSVKKILGSNQSIDDAKVAAIADAKREIIEKAGTYIESLTIVQDGSLKKDEISAMALGMMKTEIISVKNGVEGDSFFIQVTIKSEVDTESIKDKLDYFKQDKSSLSQYQEMQKNMNTLLTKFEELEKKNRALEAELKTLNKSENKSYGSSSNQSGYSQKKIYTIKEEQEKVNKEFSSIANKLESENWINKAYDLWVDGKYSDPKLAVQYFEKAISLNGDSHAAYMGKGLALYYLEDYQNSLKMYNKSLSLNPDYSHAYNNRALVYFKLKNYNAAMYDYTKAIEKDPNYALAYNNRGLLYYEIKNYQSALMDFNKSIELDPGYKNAYYSRALAKYYLKDYIGSIDDYSTSINMDPTYANAYIGRGLSYYMLNNLDKSIDDYSKGIELDPKNHIGHFDRGIAYYYLNKMEYAKYDFLKTLEIMPNYNIGSYMSIVNNSAITAKKPPVIYQGVVKKLPMLIIFIMILLNYLTMVRDILSRVRNI